VTSGQPNTINLRIETGQPGEDQLLIRVTPEFADEIEVAFGSEAVTVDHIAERSVPEVIQSVLQVTGPIAASGAILARVLNNWWHRNDRRKVNITFNGESISLEGMSEEEMAKIIDAARVRRDELWREQLPDLYPPPDGEGS
jgi:hypothetical protein